ncbi:hypothetical protein [Aquimarina sp. SS2-1]|uniref:hypothetical protein n=1 Tax=Aquimarina besae TaxID=3342247 RepID=UPI003672F2FF
MKKITLLLVAAVFAIGIQSCSTEEEVFIEESVIKKENNIPENAVHFGSKNIAKVPEKFYKRIFVRYPRGTSYQERVDHATEVGSQIFDDFYVVFDNGCAYVDEWFLRCDTCQFSPTNTKESKVVDEDELTAADATDSDLTDPNSDPTVYADCSDVPIEQITINNNGNNGGNNSDPCGFCAGQPTE